MSDSLYDCKDIFLGQLPGEWSYSIAGQLSWVNLLYEIINEAIVLPLLFFMGEAVDDKQEFINRIKTGSMISFGIYAVMTCVIMIFADKLLGLMAASPDILKASACYIRIESVANVFGILYSFVCVALVTNTIYYRGCFYLYNRKLYYKYSYPLPT